MIWKLTGHAGTVYAVAFSPDGEMLASAGGDNTVRLWRTSDGAMIRVLRTSFTSGPLCASFSPDGQLVATGGGILDRKIELWRVSDGSRIRTLTGHGDSVRSVAFSPDGETIISGSTDNTVRLWRMSDGSVIRTLTGHTDDVWSVGVSPADDMIASGSLDSRIKLWRLSDGSLVREMDDRHHVFSVDFSSDGEVLIAGGYDQISLWHVSDGLQAHLYRMDERIRSIAFSPDDQLFAYGFGNHGRVVAARNPLSGGEDCGPDAKLSATCQDGGETVIGKLKKATPDTAVTFTLDGQQSKERTTNTKGKAKIKYKNQAPGPHTVNACDLEEGC